MPDGSDGGAIHYYEDEDVTEDFRIKETYGIRTFWDLQQKQSCVLRSFGRIGMLHSLPSLLKK